MKFPLTYYHDEKMTKRVIVNEEGFPVIDWGETIPGQKKEMKLYVKNESKDNLVIRQPYTTDKDLKIENYTARIMSEDRGTVSVSLTPNTNKIESHHGSWGFEIIVG